MQELLNEIISTYISNQKGDNFVEKNRLLFREKGNLLPDKDKIAFLDHAASKGSDVFFLLFCEETHMLLSLEQAENYSLTIIQKWTDSRMIPGNRAVQQRLADSFIKFPEFISKEYIGDYYSFMFDIAIKNGLIATVQALLFKDKEIGFLSKNIIDYDSDLNEQSDKRIGRCVRNYLLTGEISENWKDYVDGYTYIPDTQTATANTEDYFKTKAKEICKDNLKSYKKSRLLSKNTTLEELDAFVDQYNWDDGVEIPYFIMHHKNCDHALRKKLFELGAGDCIDETTYIDTKKDPWKQFILELKEMIEKEDQ